MLCCTESQSTLTGAPRLSRNPNESSEVRVQAKGKIGRCKTQLFSSLFLPFFDDVLLLLSCFYLHFKKSTTIFTKHIYIYAIVNVTRMVTWLGTFQTPSCIISFLLDSHSSCPWDFSSHTSQPFLRHLWAPEPREWEFSKASLLVMMVVSEDLPLSQLLAHGTCTAWF